MLALTRQRGSQGTCIARPQIPDSDKMIASPLDSIVAAVKLLQPPGTAVQTPPEFAPYLGKSRPSYPALVGNCLIDYLCATYLGNLPINAARRLLGRCYIRAISETFTGVLARYMLTCLSMEQIMHSLPNNYAGATNFGRYSSTEIASGHWQLEFEDDPGYPDFILGTLEEGGSLIGVPGLEISCTVPALRHMVFSITWQTCLTGTQVRTIGRKRSRPSLHITQSK